MTIEVRLLGPLDLRCGGAQLGPRDLGGVKPKQLLEVLLLERGRTVAKDRIAELLWGERLPRRVAATVETYVSVLRRRLEETFGAGHRMIVTEHEGYRVPHESVVTDLDRYEALLRRALGEAARDRRATLEAAVELGELDLLTDEPYASWTLLPRAHYRERQVQALVDLAECCRDLADCVAAVAAAERALAREPTRERACRAAMSALDAAGRRDEALRIYDRCRLALANELAVTPAPETARLRLSIESDGAAEQAPQRPISYALHGSTRVAYQVAGDGPIDLVFSPSGVSNLGVTWDEPTYAGFLHRLAAMARLILFDKRGTGLSDPALDFPTTRERSEDLLAVLDDVGSERAVLFGVCGGGALCAQLAADHPDRTAGLILHNSMARLVCTADYQYGWSAELYDRFLDGFEEAWLSDGEGAVRRNPGLADNPRYRDWFARYVRLAANPWMARRLYEMNATLDVREVLGAIRSPCLVICRTDDVWLSPDNSYYLAEHIPGARLVELPGVDHDPWVGDVDGVLDVVADFLATVRESGRAANITTASAP